MFRGSELPRLTAMVVLLAVLGMLIARAREPATWQWFVRDGAASETAGGPPGEAGRKGAPEPPPRETVTAGPTDEDPEQRADAAEEFQAVTDGTVGIQPEEMLIYGRLFYWVEHQSFEALQKRARPDAVFADFMQFPDKNRGKLVRLDLNVRRVLAYDVDDGPPDVRRVYEIWGWSDESKAWLYVVATAHLPEGMPVGPEVYERARFVGYFFKLHGYYEAGAKPRAAPLRAPLLVGRLLWYPPVTQGPSASQDWWTLSAVGGALVLLGGVIVVTYLGSRKAARRRATRQQEAGDAVRQWLRGGFPTGSELPMAEDDCPAPPANTQAGLTAPAHPGALWPPDGQGQEQPETP